MLMGTQSQRRLIFYDGLLKNGFHIELVLENGLLRTVVGISTPSMQMRKFLEEADRRKGFQVVQNRANECIKSSNELLCCEKSGL